MKTDLERAASSLLSNLWQRIYSANRTFDENWDAMERTYPASRWLQNELRKSAPEVEERNEE